jgi:hypothetical protein
VFVISLADRVVKIAGITTRPDESWMLQIARNVHYALFVIEVAARRVYIAGITSIRTTNGSSRSVAISTPWKERCGISST